MNEYWTRVMMREFKNQLIHVEWTKSVSNGVKTNPLPNNNIVTCHNRVNKNGD